MTKEYSQRTIEGGEDIGEYLTEQSKEGWDMLHIQKEHGTYVEHAGGRGGATQDTYYSKWHIILVRDPDQEEVEE